MWLLKQSERPMGANEGCCYMTHWSHPVSHSGAKMATCCLAGYLSLWHISVVYRSAATGLGVQRLWMPGGTLASTCDNIRRWATWMVSVNIDCMPRLHPAGTVLVWFYLVVSLGQTLADLAARGRLQETRILGAEAKSVKRGSRRSIYKRVTAPRLRDEKCEHALGCGHMQ